MYERDYFLRKARKSNAELNWSSYKRKRNTVNNLIKQAKNQYDRNLLNDSNSNPAQFWEAIRQIYPSKSGKSGSSGAMETEDGIITSKLKIANAFGKYFANIARVLCESLNSLGGSIWLNTLSMIGTEQQKPIFSFKAVCVTDVLYALQNLKMSKAAGLDNIPPGLLKDASYFIAEPLTYLINLSMSTGLFPSEWKQAKVIPIFKSGSNTSMDNYRPISILSVVSKIL